MLLPLQLLNLLATADVTAPVLSNPTGTATGATTATGTVDTDEGNGTLYYYASTNSSESAATIKASGDSQAVTTTGTQNVSLTGLTASTVYYLHFVHDDASANESNVPTAPTFTTSAEVIEPAKIQRVVQFTQRGRGTSFARRGRGLSFSNRNRRIK